MIGVDKIEDIRKRARGGESIASIARAVGASCFSQQLNLGFHD